MKMSMEYPCVYFEKDGKCRKFSDDTAISYCVMGPCSEQKLSNADHIRAMSDEELANFLDAIHDFVEDGGGKIVDGNVIYPGNMLDWLEQPAEEDT